MFSRFLGLMNACGTVWIFLLMILINSDIVGRELFGSPVRGTTELMSLSIVGIVFLQLGHTLMTGKVTRSDMMIEALLIQQPRAGHALQCLYHIAGAALLGIILVGSLNLLQESPRHPGICRRHRRFHCPHMAGQADHRDRQCRDRPAVPASCLA